MMKVKKSYNFRIYPNKETQSKLDKTFGCCRFVYNKMLQAIKNKERLLTEKQLKETFNFLKEVDSTSLQQSTRNLFTAFKNMKTGNARYPKFKSRHNKQSYRTIYYNTKVDFKNKTIKLLKLPLIKFRDSRIFTSKIRNVTVSKNKIGHYFVSILVEEEISSIPKTSFNKDNTIGLDMGVNYFVTDSNSLKIEAPRYYRKLENKLARAQKRLSRKKKGSNNRNKQRIKVAKIHNKIANLRKDFSHKLSDSITKNYDGICIEDLNIKQMSKSYKAINKSILDIGWRTFTNQLEYKALWRGKKLIKADRFFPSSKLCSKCNTKNKTLQLNDMKWICNKCQMTHDRNINAAINLKQYFLTTVGTTGSNACGDETLVSSVHRKAGIPDYNLQIKSG